MDRRPGLKPPRPWLGPPEHRIKILRNSDKFAAFILMGALLFGLAMVHAHFEQKARLRVLNQLRGVVEQVGLTDLCLSTEARYTRHPSQADRHAPFQSHPLALDHFPSGSVVGPPPGLRKSP